MVVNVSAAQPPYHAKSLHRGLRASRSKGLSLTYCQAQARQVKFAVFGVPHEEFGQSLVAVIQPTGEVALTAEAVQAFLATRLAGFKIPRTILFRDTLPREETGKIFKRLLREEYLTGARQQH